MAIIMELSDVLTYVRPGQQLIIEDETIFKAGYVVLCQVGNTKLLKVLVLVYRII